jgi:hypothetical protein
MCIQVAGDQVAVVGEVAGAEWRVRLDRETGTKKAGHPKVARLNCKT